MSRSDDFIRITNAEIWQAIRDLQDMRPDSSPLVRQAYENKERIRGLDLKFYAILGAVTTGIVGSIVLRLAGIAA